MFVTVSHFHPSLIFSGKAWSLPLNGVPKGAPLDRPIIRKFYAVMPLHSYLQKARAFAPTNKKVSIKWVGSQIVSKFVNQQSISYLC
jgi:hypothetical protein